MEWREGGRGGEGEGDAFPGQLTYHRAQFCWRPVGDACRGERRHSLESVQGICAAGAHSPCDIWRH